jgi:hypothetical protein
LPPAATPKQTIYPKKGVAGLTGPKSQMTETTFTYEVRCKTCRTKFKVQLFESHEKNLFLVDKKDWYCDACRKEYGRQQTARLSQAHQAIGLPELTGTPKMLTWAEKVRAELTNKVTYLKQSLKHDSDAQQALSDQAFALFFQEWQHQTSAKWWIDHRKMTVRDISQRIFEITESLKKD